MQRPWSLIQRRGRLLPNNTIPMLHRSANNRTNITRLITTYHNSGTEQRQRNKNIEKSIILH